MCSTEEAPTKRNIKTFSSLQLHLHDLLVSFTAKNKLSKTKLVITYPEQIIPY